MFHSKADILSLSLPLHFSLPCSLCLCHSPSSHLPSFYPSTSSFPSFSFPLILSPVISPSIAHSLPHFLSPLLFFLSPTFFHHILSLSLIPLLSLQFTALSCFSQSSSLLPFRSTISPSPKLSLSVPLPLSLPSYLSDRAPLCSSAALSLLMTSGTSAGPVNRDCVCVCV